MKTTIKVRKSLSAASAGVLAFALSASAGVRTAQPSPSDFIDTEASTNLVFAPLQVDTRQYVLKFAGDFSPSNDLEVAFGGDANGDGDLAPEETEHRAGVDCGESFADGRACRSATAGYGIGNSISGGQGLPALPLHLTRDQQARWDLIKVTRRGFFSTEPSVTLKPRKPGMMIIVR